MDPVGREHPEVHRRRLVGFVDGGHGDGGLARRDAGDPSGLTLQERTHHRLVRGGDGPLQLTASRILETHRDGLRFGHEDLPAGGCRRRKLPGPSIHRLWRTRPPWRRITRLRFSSVGSLLRELDRLGLVARMARPPSSATSLGDGRQLRWKLRRDYGQRCPMRNEHEREAGFQREVSMSEGASRSWEHDRDTLHRTDSHSRRHPRLPRRERGGGHHFPRPRGGGRVR